MDEERPAGPLLRVVRGEPSNEEIAALTAVIAGVAAAAEPVDDGPRSRWGSQELRLRRTPRPGRDSWRASALPR